MKKLGFLALGMFTVGSGAFMIAGLLPEISQTIGQPVAVAGQGITVFRLTYLVSALLFFMIFAARSAKQTLQLALAVFLLGTFITLYSRDLFSFIFGRALSGLGAGIFIPLCVNVAVQSVGQAIRGRALSLVWGANTAGSVFGVPFGVYLSATFNWQLVLWCTLLLGIAAWLGLFVQISPNSIVSPTSSISDRLRLLGDRAVLAVIGVTCLASLASLGLYSYVALLQVEKPHSLATSLFFWGIGGFVGSTMVGTVVDRTQRPRLVMTYILAGLLFAIVTIPFTRQLTYLGPLSFFLWGAFGWALSTPQQHILFELHEEQKPALGALNSSAIGLGSALGTAIAGVAIAAGVQAIDLPFLAAALLAAALIAQARLTKSGRIKEIHCETARHHR